MMRSKPSWVVRAMVAFGACATLLVSVGVSPMAASASAATSAQPSPSPDGTPEAEAPSPVPSSEPLPSESPLPMTPAPEDPDRPVEGSSARRMADLPMLPLAIGTASVVASIVADGTAVFDSNNDPGNDSGPNNGIVRTNDTVQYRFDYSTTGASTDPRVVSLLPAGMAWTAAPPQCTGTGTNPHPSGVYDSVTGAPGGDQRLLVCQQPSTLVGVSNSISPIARVTTLSLNGQVKSVGFTADDAANEPALSNLVDVTVSAGAFYDLRKTFIAESSALGPGGTQQGLNAVYGIGIVVAHPTRTGSDAIKGMTPLASPITFQDDLSAYSPNAQLMTWRAGGACVPVTGGGTGLPKSSLTAPAATIDTAVPNSGTISCTPGAPGGAFGVTLTGTDTSGSSFPTRNGSGDLLPAGTYYVATAQVVIWMPVQDILDAGGSRVLRNTYTGFDPDDVSGRSNFGAGTEPLANNTNTRARAAGGYVYSKTYSDAYGNGTVSDGLGTRSAIGSRWASRINFNRSVVEAENTMLCDVFDRSSQRLTAYPNRTVPAEVFANNVPATGYIVEYGAPSTYPATFAEMRAATCADDAATWSTDPRSAVLGGSISPDGFRDSIDRVRLRYLVPVPGTSSQNLYIGLRVTGPSTLDPANNPDGVLLPNFARIATDGTELVSLYNPVTNSGQLGARLYLVGGEVRVTKSTTSGQVAPGGDAVFTLRPTVTTNGAVGDPLRDVVVTDVLPVTSPRLTVNALAVSRPTGAGVEFCDICDGSDWRSAAYTATHGVRWLLGDIVPGTAVPPLTFSARVPLSAPNGVQYVNQGVVSSPDDPSTVSLRSSSATVQVLAGATVYATKSAPQPLVGMAGPVVWDLSMRNATNVPLTRVDAVDVLPFVGDGRTPASSFSGGFAALSASNLPTGVTAYVTDTDPDVLDAQDGATDGFADPGIPGDAWFEVPGSGGWSCTIAQLGSPGCPTTASVTAVRFATAPASAAPVLAAGASVTWQLSMVPSGHAPGDTFTNRFLVRVNQNALALPVSSPDVPVSVVAPTVTLQKQTCTAATVVLCDPEDDTVWAESHLVRPGETGMFRVRVVNTSSLPGQISVSDAVPAGLEFVAGSARASQGDVSQFPDRWTIDALEPGESAWVVLEATIPADGPQTNTASVVMTDQFGQSATATDSSDLVAAPTDVALTKTVVSSDIDLDGSGVIDYRLTVVNTGLFEEAYNLTDALAFGDGLEVTGATITSTDPEGLATNPSWNGDTDTTMTIAPVPIAAGATHTIEVQVQVRSIGGLPDDQRLCDAGGGFANTAVVTGDGFADDAYACVDAPASGLTVVKTGPAGVVSGGDLTWTIRVTNIGDLTAVGTTVADALPDGTRFVSADTDGVEADGTVLWTLPNVLPGETLTLTVAAKVDPGLVGTIRNCVTTTAPEGWDRVDDACADTTATPIPIPDPLIPIINGLAQTGSTIPMAAGLIALGALLGGALLLRRRRGVREGDEAGGDTAPRAGV